MEVQRRYGIPPALVPDFIALRGDPSDGLPGAPGVGPKTAAELLQRHGSLERAIADAEQERPRVRAALTELADQLRSYREIATLQTAEREPPPDRATDLEGGAKAARAGSTSPTGDSTLAQTFTATSGQLSFWYRMVCPDTITYDWFTVTLKDSTTGTTTTPLAKTCASPASYQQVTAAVTAGHSYTLTLTNHDDNYPGDASYTFIDDVALS